MYIHIWYHFRKWSFRAKITLWPPYLWQHRFGSTLVQVMFCCLTAPNHYWRQVIIWTQCWIIVNWNLANIFQWNLNQSLIIFIEENAFRTVVCEMAVILSKGRWVNLHCGFTWLISKVHMPRPHYSVIMSAIGSQITSPTIVYSTVYSGVDQRKHQSSASLALGNSPVIRQ